MNVNEVARGISELCDLVNKLRDENKAQAAEVARLREAQHEAECTAASAANRARDDKVMWAKDFEEACERHGALCDALWEELERQIALFDGLVPVAEHPALKRQKMIAQMRREVADTVKHAITEALDELAKSPMMDSYA